ncbi:hypothetical protein [Pontibacter burrus]|uniref:Uncharacterized protein n=1 Tax=Pontibacter burrus TaxID=2704466 RepID=A0A6B3LQY0_9BACT|nr:hypothetical protein [Pontibacter burrus]NEM96398.1 hypothetical protein [Pontibacter burrus]
MLDILRTLLISFVAVLVLLPVVRYAIRRLLMGHLQHVLTPEEAKYMQKQEWKLIWLYFIFACVLTVFSAGILAMISSIIHSAGSNFLHLLTPNFDALIAPGLLLGFTLALVPLRLSQRAILNHDYDLYKDYLAQAEGHHSLRFWRVAFLVMLVLAGTLSAFALKWQVTISENHITVTEPFTEEHKYQFSDISRIEYLGNEGEYIITFNDNAHINTTYLKPVKLELIAFLSEKSGKKVIR